MPGGPIGLPVKVPSSNPNPSLVLSSKLLLFATCTMAESPAAQVKT